MASAVVQLARWLGVALDRPLENRLRALKFRTFVTVLIAIGCVVLGVLAVTSPFVQLCRMVFGLLQQGNFPLAHAPLGAVNHSAYFFLQVAFWLVSATAVLGSSAGIFGRIRIWQRFLPSVILGFATLVFLPPTAQWLGLFPSKLEMSIARGDFDAADNILNLTRQNTKINPYIKAQIALRAKDQTSLQTYGQAVLRQADEWVYGQNDGSAEDKASRDLAVLFEPEVVYALDVALNGLPQTQVGIRWQQEQKSRVLSSVWFGVIVSVVLGLILLLIAMMLLSLWRGMRKRVVEIQDQILLSGCPQPQFESKSGGEQTDETAKYIADDEPLVSALGAIGVAMFLVLIVGCALWLWGRLPVAVSAVVEPSTDVCDYVGVWLEKSPEKNMHQTITLEASGRYLIETSIDRSESANRFEYKWNLRDGGIELTNNSEWKPYFKIIKIQDGLLNLMTESGKVQEYERQVGGSCTANYINEQKS